jgi:hypothetical protein
LHRTRATQHAVPHVFGDETVEAANRLRDAAVIGADHLAQFFGIEPRRRRADQVAEHHRRLATLRGATRGAGDAATGGAPDTASIGLPQPPQNSAEGSFAKPQFAHGAGSAVPHRAQKRLVRAFSVMQVGQRIGCTQHRETIQP